jgi:hypothetical protein
MAPQLELCVNTADISTMYVQICSRAADLPVLLEITLHLPLVILVIMNND